MKCAYAGCDAPYYAKGFCRYHYSRFIKHGSPDPPDWHDPDPDDFVAWLQQFKGAYLVYHHV